MKNVTACASISKSARWDEALRQVAECLAASGECYFVDCGTLLGAIREGDYIRWDNDIDLGLIRDGKAGARYLKLAEQINRRGFTVNLAENGFCCLRAPDVEINVTFYLRRGDAYEATLYTAKKRYAFMSFLKHIRDGKYHATLGVGAKFRLKRFMLRNAWLLRPLPDLLLNHFAEVKVHRIRVPAQHLEIRRRTFHGMDLLFPANPPEYLTFRYGPDWRVPKKEYRYEKDDGALAR
jgi:hypothetical protein